MSDHTVRRKPSPNEKPRTIRRQPWQVTAALAIMAHGHAGNVRPG
jgi:hypothetical protein